MVTDMDRPAASSREVDGEVRPKTHPRRARQRDFATIHGPGWHVSVWPRGSVILGVDYTLKHDAAGVVRETCGVSLQGTADLVLACWANIRDTARTHLVACPTIDEVRAALAEGALEVSHG